MKKVFYYTICAFLKVFLPIKKRVFVFQKGFSDSPRFIYKALHEKYTDFELVWMTDNVRAFSNPFDKSDFVKIVKYSHIAFIKYLLSSFCVISTGEFTWQYLVKRKKQFFIQTYHGDRGPKKILFDTSNCSDDEVCDDKVVDLAIAASKFGAERYKTAFHYSGKILLEGMPRNDVLIRKDEELVQNIKKTLNISNNNLVILYAPTYRNNKTLCFENSIDFEQIYNSLNQKCTILIRMHNAIVSHKHNITCNDHIIDVSDYPDVSDFLLISDIIISDYSSTPFDFALTSGSVILYLPDYNEYTEASRECYFDVRTIGFDVALNTHEIIQIICSLSNKNSNKNASVLSKLGTVEKGRSSSTIADIIFEEYLNRFKNR